MEKGKGGSEEFTWKGQIEFKGSAAQFKQLADVLEKLPVEVKIPEWFRHPCHFAGCMPIPVDRLLGIERLNKIIEGMPQIQVKYIRDVYGGIREANVHLEKDMIALLDQARFKTFVGEVAKELGAMRVDLDKDYITVMSPVNRLLEPGIGASSLADPTTQPA